jgi:hypothetical protein
MGGRPRDQFDDDHFGVFGAVQPTVSRSEIRVDDVITRLGFWPMDSRPSLVQWVVTVPSIFNI